jgi:hypothetical protein
MFLLTLLKPLISPRNLVLIAVVLTLGFLLVQNKNLKEQVKLQKDEMASIRMQLALVELESKLAEEQSQELLKFKQQAQSQLDYYKTWIKDSERRNKVKQGLKNNDQATVDGINRFIDCNLSSFGQLKDCSEVKP